MANLEEVIGWQGRTSYLHLHQRTLKFKSKGGRVMISLDVPQRVLNVPQRVPKDAHLRPPRRLLVSELRTCNNVLDIPREK